MTRSTRGLVFAAALGLVALGSLSAPVAAQRGYSYRDDGPRYVVAESHFGNGTVQGAVRYGPKGYQVRMPRGTWIDCVRSCADTLRRETIDFWQTHGHNAPGSARGYLHWEFRY